VEYFYTSDLAEEMNKYTDFQQRFFMMNQKLIKKDEKMNIFLL